MAEFDWMANKADWFALLFLSFDKEITWNYVFSNGHSFVFKFVLQTEVRASIMVPLPTLTYSVGMMSTLADCIDCFFHLFS